MPHEALGSPEEHSMDNRASDRAKSHELHTDGRYQQRGDTHRQRANIVGVDIREETWSRRGP